MGEYETAPMRLTDSPIAEASDTDPTSLELIELRARKFHALATLFRLDVEGYSEAIETLLTSCPGIFDCPVKRGAAHDAGNDAAAWVRDHVDYSTLADEHRRLFGGTDITREMPMVSPCAATYMSAGYDGNPADVVALYDASGFEAATTSGVCELHITNELEFMAYCLRMGALGNRDAVSVAHAFITAHLFDWGVVFSAAIYSRSDHPVTRFAGMMLEHMLFCEVGNARSHSRFYSGLVRSRYS